MREGLRSKRGGKRDLVQPCSVHQRGDHLSVQAAAPLQTTSGKRGWQGAGDCIRCKNRLPALYMKTI